MRFRIKNIFYSSFIPYNLLSYHYHFIFHHTTCYFQCWVMSDSLGPCELKHTRFPCPSLSPGVCLHSFSLSQWCLPISSSVVLFSSCLQSFPAGSFPMSQLFISGGQIIGASISVLSVNIQEFRWGLTGLISLLTKRISRNLTSHILL